MIFRQSHNKEPFYLVKGGELKKFITRGFLTSNEPHWYINDHSDLPSLFNFKGRTYKVEYMSGCFYPFLLCLAEYNRSARDLTYVKNISELSRQTT